MFLDAEDLRERQMSSCGLGERPSALEFLPTDGSGPKLHLSVKSRTHIDSQVSCRDLKWNETSGLRVSVESECHVSARLRDVLKR